MERIAIYGKGGIGKSTISSALSAAFSSSGKKTLLVGCDPKQDSTIRLTKNRIKSVINMSMEKNDIKKEDIVKDGFSGVDCVECGGPKPGVGCAGRGIMKMFEIFDEINILDEREYDVAIFDVLGDVVCGGFAAPLRKGVGEKIFIVISEEIMSLYAANNILHAINTYSYNNIYFAGFILNMRDNKSPTDHIDRFVRRTGTNIIAVIPRSKYIFYSEKDNMTVIEKYPESKISLRFNKLSDAILNISKEDSRTVKPLDDIEFNKVMMGTKK